MEKIYLEDETNGFYAGRITIPLTKEDIYGTSDPDQDEVLALNQVLPLLVTLQSQLPVKVWFYLPKPTENDATMQIELAFPRHLSEKTRSTLVQVLEQNGFCKTGAH
jgi:hypothetical protein